MSHSTPGRIMFMISNLIIFRYLWFESCNTKFCSSSNPVGPYDIFHTMRIINHLFLLYIYGLNVYTNLKSALSDSGIVQCSFSYFFVCNELFIIRHLWFESSGMISQFLWSSCGLNDLTYLKVFNSFPF